MKIFKLLLFGYLLILVSCKQDISLPLIITGEVSDISENGVKFNAYITNIGSQDIIDYGFVWGFSQSPTIEKDEKISFTSDIKKGLFTMDLQYGLIPNREYSVRAYIRDKNNITYGENIKFKSLGVKEKGTIDSISPKIGNISDIITIYGKYFSSHDITASINDINAEIVNFNTDSITVKIPAKLNNKTSHVTIENLYNNITAKDSFTLYSPEIHDISPNQITYGDEITIKGSNFTKSPNTLKVLINNTLVPFTLIDDNNIKTIIPEDFESAHKIGVEMNNIPDEYDGQVVLKPFQIVDFNPKVILTGKKVTISGMNFSTNIERNIIYIDGIKVKPIYADKEKLEFIVPVQDTVIYSNRNVKIEIENNGLKLSFTEQLQINDKWFRKKDLPINMEHQYVFQVNGVPYVGLNNSKYLWTYSPSEDRWTRKALFPGEARRNGVGIIVGDKIYFGTGSGAPIGNGLYEKFDDWWEYNTSTDTWSKKPDFPNPVSGLRGFSTLSGGYLHDNYTTQYNEANDSFTYTLIGKKYNQAINYWTTEKLASIVLPYGSYSFTAWEVVKSSPSSNQVLIFTYHPTWMNTETMYIMNIAEKKMERITGFPKDITPNALSFMLNNRYYVKIRDTDNYNLSVFYYYDWDKKSWIYTEFSPYFALDGGYYSFTFEIDNIGYIGSGSNYNNNNKFYEFDPNR